MLTYRAKGSFNVRKKNQKAGKDNKNILVFKSYEKPCNRCAKKFKGGKFQIWCDFCRRQMSNIYWAEYD